MDAIDKLGISTAMAKARKSFQEGGIPIGAALVYHGSSTDPKDAVVLGCAHNSRIQKSSATLHGEMAALEDAGRLKAQVYRGSTMVGLAMTEWVRYLIFVSVNEVHDIKAGVIIMLLSPITHMKYEIVLA